MLIKLKPTGNWIKVATSIRDTLFLNIKGHKII